MHIHVLYLERGALPVRWVSLAAAQPVTTEPGPGEPKTVYDQFVEPRSDFLTRTCVDGPSVSVASR